MSQMKKTMPHVTVQASKAWTEMIHRYVAGTLATLVFVIVCACLYLGLRERRRLWVVLGLFLCVLVVYQALLGRWTVTMKLWPIVVTQHLMGGYVLAIVLWLVSGATRESGSEWLDSDSPSKLGRYLSIVGVFLLLIQIALGAWTSTNYASLSCPGFPYCHSHLLWPHAFQQAFQYLRGGAVNYDGGVLSEAARGTIQMVHRAGALIIGLYWLSFIVWLGYQAPTRTRLIRPTLLTGFCLMMQLTLGILNVMLKLPLPIAILHTVFAALLLWGSVQIVTVYWRLSNGRQQEVVDGR
jgi:cytochrome c oxidase assembly protein subunit 15